MSLILVVILTACSSGQSLEELQTQVDGLAQELSTVVAERDTLLAEKAVAGQRFAKTSATVETVNSVVSDPQAFGTEDEVLERLRAFTVPGAVTNDLAYGSVDTIRGWRNTLFGGSVDAETYVWFDWVCEDGSQAGSLWTWRGLNVLGDPFELIGVNVSDFNEQGLETHQTVAWPYEFEHVYEEFGTAP